MKRSHIVIIIFSVFCIGARPVDDVPQADITNGLIKARVYLPDPVNGYYRGSRFDWSGNMPELEYQGHTYFGQWFDKYSPTIHDAIMGPVEDFYPVGYDEAKAGESFLKIGIGMVAKPAEAKYTFVTPYKLVNGGSWKVKKKKASVEFVHKLIDRQYAYEYKKKIELVKGKPEMIISHTFRNTGSLDIESNVYNHNFFVIDKQPLGTDFEVTFPFKLFTEIQSKGGLGQLHDNKIVFLKNLSKNEHLFYQSLQGFGASPSDYDIRIENHKTGAAVRITSDRPISKLVFWSAHATLCPEPYIKMKAAPGEQFSWKINYQFYTCEKK